MGTQVDLRDDPKQVERMMASQRGGRAAGLITQEQGERLARELGGRKYVECSALTQKGLKNVFDEVSAWDIDMEYEKLNFVG